MATEYICKRISYFMCKCGRSIRYWCDFRRSRYSGFADDGMFLITCECLSLHLPRVSIPQQHHSQIRMGWHIHHMQPVSPRDKSVKLKFRASITHDYGDCSYWRLMGLLPYINSTYVTKFCSYLPELLFSWV